MVLLLRPRWILVFLVTINSFRDIEGVAIDNDILGEPDIECLDEEIRFWVKTRKFFAGRIYAKGRADEAACVRADYANERTNKPHFDLQFGACGMRSLRSVDPRGMYYGITVVVSFHPLFITKVDQAFHVKCFFEETNRGLTAELGVSMIPTTEVQARHGIPGCTYSIHKSSIQDLDRGGTAGQPIKFARVGDKVLHQWWCDDQMFGILINNCYVTDGFGQRADVIDNRGCPIDPILITGIRYSADLQHAYAQSHVFKFADKPGVWFFCHIQMCMKAAGMCRGVSPPNCGQGGNGGYAGSIGTLPPGPTDPFNGPDITGPYFPPVSQTFQPVPLPLTPFGPAYPPNGGGDPYTGQGFPSLQEVQEVTVGYDAEIPVIYERSDTPGVTFDRASTQPASTRAKGGGGGGTSLEPKFRRLLEQLPPNLELADLQRLISRSGQPRVVLDSLADARFLGGNGRGSVVRDGADAPPMDWAQMLADDEPPPEIAGQLIVFDLDEDPPASYMKLTQLQASLNSSEFDAEDFAGSSDGRQSSSSDVVAAGREDCVISADGLKVLLTTTSGAAALFFLISVVMCCRYCRSPSKNPFLEHPSSALPYERYPSPSSSQQPHRAASRHDRSRNRSTSRHRHHQQR